jgi:hypothetical protein
VILFQHVDRRRRGSLDEWLEGLEDRERAAISSKLLSLQRIVCTSEADWGNCGLRGPIRGFKHLYKMKLGGSVQLRPIFCRGPVKTLEEVTFLLGALEVGGKWEPEDAPKRAEERRKEVSADVSRRREWRSP